MSAKLAMKVLESDLSPSLKPTAVVMALFGNDHGEKIFPSVDRVAFLLGVSRRTAERQLAELRRAGILVAQERPGGRGRTVLYRLRIDALPTRPAYKPRHQCQGLDADNPDASVRDPQHETPTPATDTPTSMTETPTPVSLNPDASVGRSVRENVRENTTALSSFSEFQKSDYGKELFKKLKHDLKTKKLPTKRPDQAA